MTELSLPYFIGTVTDLQAAGVDAPSLRKSLTGEITVDGETVTDTHLAIVHLHSLTIDQFNAILRMGGAFTAVTHEQAKTLMQTADWGANDTP